MDFPCKEKSTIIPNQLNKFSLQIDHIYNIFFWKGRFVSPFQRFHPLKTEISIYLNTINNIDRPDQLLCLPRINTHIFALYFLHITNKDKKKTEHWNLHYTNKMALSKLQFVVIFVLCPHLVTCQSKGDTFFIYNIIYDQEW